MSYKEMIYDALKDSGFTYSSMFAHEYSMDDAKREVIKKLDYIPVSTLQELSLNVQTIIKECGTDKTFAYFMKSASKMGYLKFEPYIKENECGTPTLILKYNRYVHLFRGYHYQCSYTADGHGEYSSAGSRTDYLNNIFGRELRESKLLKVLYYMNLIACCKGIDAFDNLLKTNPELVDKFMKASTKDVFDSYDITYMNDMMNVFSLVDTGASDEKQKLPEPKDIFRVALNATTDMCRIKIYDTRLVGIEVWLDEKVQEVLFTLPDWTEGVNDKRLRDEADWEDMYYEEYIKWKTDVIYSKKEILTSFINYALNTCGFVTNYMVTYPMNDAKDSKLRALNRQDIKEFKSLNDVPKYDK